MKQYISQKSRLFQIPQRYRFSSKSQPVAAAIGAAGSLFQIPQRYRFSSKSQQWQTVRSQQSSCFRYHKGTDFQANHNILKGYRLACQLFQIPQRYRFSSKSQLSGKSLSAWTSCFRYHKGTDFQANHNSKLKYKRNILVVLDTTKVQIFKQITTVKEHGIVMCMLFQIPQRYRFSSKSQRFNVPESRKSSCFRYHKGTDFQANHNC